MTHHERARRQLKSLDGFLSKRLKCKPKLNLDESTLKIFDEEFKITHRGPYDEVIIAALYNVYIHAPDIYLQLAQKSLTRIASALHVIDATAPEYWQGLIPQLASGAFWGRSNRAKANSSR